MYFLNIQPYDVCFIAPIWRIYFIMSSYLRGTGSLSFVSWIEHISSDPYPPVSFSCYASHYSKSQSSTLGLSVSRFRPPICTVYISLLSSWHMCTVNVSSHNARRITAPETWGSGQCRCVIYHRSTHKEICSCCTHQITFECFKVLWLLCCDASCLAYQQYPCCRSPAAVVSNYRGILLLDIAKAYVSLFSVIFSICGPSFLFIHMAESSEYDLGWRHFMCHERLIETRLHSLLWVGGKCQFQSQVTQGSFMQNELCCEQAHKRGYKQANYFRKTFFLLLLSWLFPESKD